ncbi:MAG TPA: type 4a pilus biogenesis protein PilO [bacterium]|nr:type 4a pilus biogenesis protein PilO [bacterium]
MNWNAGWIRSALELKSRKPALWIAGVSAGAGILVCLFLYPPLVRDLGRLSEECRRAEARAVEARPLIKAFKTAALLPGFIREEEISETIRELTSQGKSRDIRFIGITPQAVTKPQDSGYPVVPIEIDAESGYQDLGLFLGALEELKKSLVTVKDFHIVPDRDAPAKLRTKLTLWIYLKG